MRRVVLVLGNFTGHVVYYKGRFKALAFRLGTIELSYCFSEFGAMPFLRMGLFFPQVHAPGDARLGVKAVVLSNQVWILTPRRCPFLGDRPVLFSRGSIRYLEGDYFP